MTPRLYYCRSFKGDPRPALDLALVTFRERFHCEPDAVFVNDAATAAAIGPLAVPVHNLAANMLYLVLPEAAARQAEGLG